MKSISSFLVLLLAALPGMAQLVLERDINLEAASSQPQGVFAELNGLLYFAADDGLHGIELYQFDLSTNQASLVSNVRPYEDGSGVNQIIAYQGKIYFNAFNGVGVDDFLFVHDPATQTTERLSDANNDELREPGQMIEFGNQLFYSAEFPGVGRELGRYNPTDNVFELVANIHPSDNSNPSDFVIGGGNLYFAASDGQSNSQLWRYVPLTDTVENVIYQSPNQVFPSIRFLYYHDGKCYFQGYTQATGDELFAIDLGSNTLLSIPEVYPGIASSSPAGFVALGGKLYFSARTASSGRELHVYDPVSNQVSQVFDFWVGGNGNPGDIFVSGNKLYFTASVNENERKLYSLQPGQATPTVEASLPNGSDPNFLSTAAIAGGRLFLTCNLLATGTELYSFPLSGGNITLAADINQTTIGSNPYGFTPFAGKLYFAANEINSGAEIWVYNPATGQVEILLDGPGSTNPNNFAALGGRLYFSGTHPTLGYGLMYVDSATEQVLPTSYFTPGNSGHITDVVAYAEKIYFSALDNALERELYVYDPLTNTASIAADIYPGGSGRPEGLFVWEGKLYFRADDGVHGTELWSFNDNTQFASLVADINPGSDESYPESFAVYQGELYFSAFRQGVSYEIFSYNSVTDSVTQRTNVSGNLNPSNLAVYRGKLYFNGRFPAGVNAELGCYDATLDTTYFVEDLTPGASNPRDLVVFNDLLYFSTFTGAYGRELWVFNDTSLSIVSDLRPGPPNGDPVNLVLFNGKLYFAANDGIRGEELWSMAQCLNIVVDSEASFGTNDDGSIDLTINGGLPPYRILWSTGDSTEDLTGLAPGVYTATVSDASGCLSEVTAEVQFVNSLFEASNAVPVELRPNPAAGICEVRIGQGRLLGVVVLDLQGRTCLRSDAVDHSSAKLELSSLSPGLYVVRVETNLGLATKRLQVLR